MALIGCDSAISTTLDIRLHRLIAFKRDFSHEICTLLTLNRLNSGLNQGRSRFLQINYTSSLTAEEASFDF